MHYLRFKKEKIDICNICLKEKPLSWDHVPPQGGIEVTEVEQSNIIQKLAITGENTKLKFSQDGVKFRTICESCNNDLLGSDFDKELNKFAFAVKNTINSSLVLPSITHYKVKPKKLVKAIFGHLLSAKVDNKNLTMSPIDKSLRAYFFDKIDEISVNLKVYYWLYPYQSTIIIRDIAMLQQRGNLNSKFAGFDILKYHPIGYIITSLDKYEDLPELTKYTSTNIDDEVEIPINLLNVKDSYWPERVNGEDYNIIGGSKNSTSIYATPKKEKTHIFRQ